MYPYSNLWFVYAVLYASIKVFIQASYIAVYMSGTYVPKIDAI